ncbi:alpha/beta fold hydrolase [Amaricoccus solimangrovi]|nr:alpha/beta hydrolase [Amaricoccus solimangrovi]
MRSILTAFSLTTAVLTPWETSLADDGAMQVDGAELSYSERGEGRPVVFVHGALSDARIWDGYAGTIAAQGRFMAYTQRYFGTGDWPDKGERFSRETHVGDLIAFVEGLHAGPVDLVTWSYSGEIATYAALRRPDLFRSMVHFEPDVVALLDGLPGAAAANAQAESTLGPGIAALEADRPEEAALRFIEAVFRMPEGAAENEPEPFPAYWRENGRTLPFFVAMEPGPAISCADLGALRVPTLIVVGTDTLVSFAMEAEQLARCSGNALLTRMEDVTHDGPYRRPDRFAELILAFRAIVGPE